MQNNLESLQGSTSVATDSHPSPARSTAREGRHLTSSETLQVDDRSPAVPSLLLGHPVVEHYLGIPKSLVLTLVEVYYDNVYNATLLLHKGLFLRSLAAGTARPHLVLSVCAWAAKYATEDSRF